MNILVAIDSFKGSAASKELNEAFLTDISDPRVKIKRAISIADGGEGTIQALYDSLGGQFETEQVPDLMGNMIEAEFLVTNIDGDSTAFVESAVVVGIDRIIPDETSIIKSSSYGLGLLIKKIINQGIKTIYITLGGSGTSDGGLGFLKGLGAKLSNETELNPLLTTEEIDLDEVITLTKSINIIALADVTNPYVGETGFSMIFGPQKGGSQKQLIEMDKRATKVGWILSEIADIDINHYPGSGAAGGLGGSILAIGGQIRPGFEAIADLIELEKLIIQSDLVITGEGKIDEQTEFGKVPFGVAKLANKYHKPVLAVCGKRTEKIGNLDKLILGVFPILLEPMSLEEAMNKETTLTNVRLIGKSLVNVFLELRQTND